MLDFCKIQASNRHFLINILFVNPFVFQKSFHSLFIIIQDNLKVKQVQALYHAVKEFNYDLLIHLGELRKFGKLTKFVFHTRWEVS